MQKAKSSWTKIGLFACILSTCAGIGCGFWWHFDSASKDRFAGFTILSLGCVLLFKVRNIRNIPNHTELITIGNHVRITLWTLRKAWLLTVLALIVLVLSQMDFMVTGKISAQEAAYLAQRRQLEERMELKATRSSTPSWK